MNGLAQVLEYGKHKYDEWNWAKGMEWSRMYGAALRHLTAHMNGEDKDPESGLSHLDHAVACLVFLSTYEKCELGTDDRHPLTNPKSCPNPVEYILKDKVLGYVKEDQKYMYKASDIVHANPDKTWYDSESYWKGATTRTVNGITLRYHPETGYEYKV